MCNARRRRRAASAIKGVASLAKFSESSRLFNVHVSFRFYSKRLLLNSEKFRGHDVRSIAWLGGSDAHGGEHHSNNLFIGPVDRCDLGCTKRKPASRVDHLGARQEALPARWRKQADLELDAEHLTPARREGECGITAG